MIRLFSALTITQLNKHGQCLFRKKISPAPSHGHQTWNSSADSSSPIPKKIRLNSAKGCSRHSIGHLLQRVPASFVFDTLVYERLHAVIYSALHKADCLFYFLGNSIGACHDSVCCVSNVLPLQFRFRFFSFINGFDSDSDNIVEKVSATVSYVCWCLNVTFSNMFMLLFQYFNYVSSFLLPEACIKVFSNFFNFFIVQWVVV